MRTRALVGVVAVGLGGLAVLAVPAVPMTFRGAKSPHCRRGQLPLRGTFSHGKLTVKSGRRAPVVACLKRPPTGLAKRYRAFERLLDDPHFVAARLRREERGLLRRDRRLRGTLRRSEQLGDHASLRALGRSAILPQASRRTRSGALPSYTEGGVTATGTGLEIEPDEDEVGFGGEADYTVRASGDRVETILRNLDRKAAFAKRCPDAKGQVEGDMEFRKLRGKTEVGFGRRRVQTVDERITATFVGHVNDDAQLTDYDIKGEYTIEGKGYEEIAGTGKLLYSAPSQVVRGRFAIRGQGGGPIDASKISGNAVGPKGWIRGDDAGNLWLYATGEAKDEASKALGMAEAYWRTTFDKITQEEGGNCVRLEFTPNPLRIGSGDTKPVEARLFAKADGAEVAGKFAIGDYGPYGYAQYPTEGSTSPQSATSSPGTPAIFNHTAPDPAPERWATMNAQATSKRGIAVAAHFAERPPPAPRAYVGTITGYYRESGGAGTENEDWTASGLRFDRKAGSPDSSPSYELTQGSVDWTYSATYTGTGCTASGSATFNPLGGTAAAGIDFSGPSEYHGAADYYREGTTTLTCPPDYSASGPRQAFPEWWSTNANEGGLSDTGPNWKLEGEATDSSGALHYEWSLTPVF